MNHPQKKESPIVIPGSTPHWYAEAGHVGVRIWLDQAHQCISSKFELGGHNLLTAVSKSPYDHKIDHEDGTDNLEDNQASVQS